MKLYERMKRSIANMEGEVILTREMLKLGEKSNVSKCLKQLVDDGVLFKIGFGVYAKAKRLPSGKVAPRCIYLRELAGQALTKLGIRFTLGELERDYNNGSTQVPAGVSFEVFDKRISRKISINSRVVKWENKLKDKPKE